MTELKISISDDLAKKIEEHPEINWASIIGTAIENYLNQLKLHDGPITSEELHKLSEYTLNEFLEKEPDLYNDRDLVKRYK